MKKTEKQYYENGNIESESEVNENGQLHGVTRIYHENGQLLGEISFTNDIQDDGEFISYHENGRKAKELTYLNNLLNGPFYEYHKNGQLIIEGLYNNGVITFLKEWDENGVLTNETSTNNNLFSILSELTLEKRYTIFFVLIGIAKSEDFTPQDVQTHLSNALLELNIEADEYDRFIHGDSPFDSLHGLSPYQKVEFSRLIKPILDLYDEKFDANWMLDHMIRANNLDPFLSVLY